MCKYAAPGRWSLELRWVGKEERWKRSRVFWDTSKYKSSGDVSLVLILSVDTEGRHEHEHEHGILLELDWAALHELKEGLEVPTYS